MGYRPLASMKITTHEDYLVAVATAVCEQYPAMAAALSEVQLVFGTGPRRRGLASLQRVWGGGEADEPMPLVEIAAIGGLTAPETCHVVLHELRIGAGNRPWEGVAVRGAPGGAAEAAGVA